MQGFQPLPTSGRGEQIRVSSPGAQGATVQAVFEADEGLQLTEHALPNERPLLTYAAIRALGSWEEARAAYTEALGGPCRDDAELLAYIKSDWARIASALVEEAVRAPIPESFPRTTVAVDGAQIDVFGIWHSISVHREVAYLLHRTLAGAPLLLAEQNLGVMNLGLHSSGLDLPDHFARGVFSDVVGESYLDTTSPRASELAAIQERYGVRDDAVAALSRMFLVMPGDSAADMPANVELSYKHEKNLRYSRVQARSAYMAEFLRNWDVQASLRNTSPDISDEQIDELARRKQIVCGQAHQPEIQFFLEQGSRESAVTERAKRDADAFSTGGIEALLKIHSRNRNAFWACEIPLTLIKGGGLGWALTSLLTL